MLQELWWAFAVWGAACLWLAVAARTATVGLAWGCALAALAAWVLVGHPHRAATPALVRRARA